MCLCPLHRQAIATDTYIHVRLCAPTLTKNSIHSALLLSSSDCIAPHPALAPWQHSLCDSPFRDRKWGSSHFSKVSYSFVTLIDVNNLNMYLVINQPSRSMQVRYSSVCGAMGCPNMCVCTYVYRVCVCVCWRERVCEYIMPIH